MLSVLIASESLTLPACRVRDGVFSASACSALHDEASTLGRSKHHLHRGAPRSVLEQALDSFLDEVDDPDRYVEYWTRQQWVHLEAHADVDEALCAATGCGDQPGALPRTLGCLGEGRGGLGVSVDGEAVASTFASWPSHARVADAPLALPRVRGAAPAHSVRGIPPAAWTGPPAAPRRRRTTPT